jgi:hypothetical protein
LADPPEAAAEREASLLWSLLRLPLLPRLRLLLCSLEFLPHREPDDAWF